MEAIQETSQISTTSRFRMWYLKIFRGLRVDVIRKYPIFGALGLIVYGKSWTLISG